MRLDPAVCVTETAYGTVLLDTRTGTYWQLNETGSAVLAALSQGYTETEAVRRLTDGFQVDEQRAAKDIAGLLDQLRSAGVMTE